MQLLGRKTSNSIVEYKTKKLQISLHWWDHVKTAASTARNGWVTILLKEALSVLSMDHNN